MSKNAIPTWCFSLVVVRMGRRFLVVQERKHDQLWYLPAGRVEAGETFADAAIRETLEESGIHVKLTGIIKVERSPQLDGGARMRVIFVGHPVDDTLPKSEPDDESLQARFVTMEELNELAMRGAEMRRLFESVLNGAPVYPLSLIQPEG